MLKIKADKMNDLEKFGFEKDGKSQYIFRHENYLSVLRVYGTGRISFSTKNYTDIVLNKLFELFKADMVEE